MSLYDRITARQEQQRLAAEEKKLLPPEQPQAMEQQEPEQPPEVSAGRKFMYGFDSTDSLTGNMADYFEARLPLGDITTSGYVSPDEIYGEGFMDMSIPERRVRIREVKEQALAKDYPVISELISQDQYKGGAAGVVGTVAGALADPTTLFPAGNGVKGAFVIGAGLGVAWSLAEDLVSKDGEVDVKKALITGAASGVGSAAMIKAVQAAKGYVAKRKDAKLVAKADNTVDEINLATAKGVSAGVPREQMADFVQAEVGKTADEIAEVVSIAQNPVVAPATKKAAQLQVEASKIGTDRGKFAGAVDTLVGATSSRVKSLSEPVFGKLRQLEFNVSNKTHQYREQIKPLISSMKQVKKASKDDYNKLSLHLMNGRMNEAGVILRKYDPEGGVANLAQTRKMLDEFYNNSKKAGMKIGKVQNYFPRTVKDHDDFVKSLGREPRTALEDAYVAKAKSLKIPVSQLDDEIKAEVTNKFISGTTRSAGKGGYTKAREVDAVTEDMLKLYDDPIDAINNHIRKSVNDIEKHNFFGKGNLVSGANNKMDVDESIGELVNRQLVANKINHNQADELKALLSVRFNQGEKSPSKMARVIRDWGYAATLANPFSALIQLGDVGSAFYANGIKNTAKTMVKTATNSKVNMKELRSKLRPRVGKHS